MSPAKDRPHAARPVVASRRPTLPPRHSTASAAAPAVVAVEVEHYHDDAAEKEAESAKVEAAKQRARAEAAEARAERAERQMSESNGETYEEGVSRTPAAFNYSFLGTPTHT